MPVIRDIPLNLETKGVLRREGIKQRSRLRPKVATLLQELLTSINDDNLLEPAMAYEFHVITRVGPDRLCLKGNAVLHGSSLSSVLSAARELAAVVCTIGPKLEKKVTDHFNSNEPLRGLLLDGIGSAAVDSLTQEVCKFMMHEASSRGYQASSPLSPGMPGLDISEQRRLFQLVPAEEIGVRLTESAMLVPRKSVSMVMGMGTEMPTWTQAEVCARCSLGKTCLYRIHT